MLVVAVVEGAAAAELMYPGLPVVEFVSGPEGRIGSTLGSASILAAYLAGMLPVLYAEWKRLAGLWKMVPSVLIAGSLTLILASGSRGGLVAALAASGGYLALSTEKRKTAVFAFGALVCTLCLVILAVPPLQHRFFGFFAGTGTASLERRGIIWEAAWGAIRAAPMLGHGTGSFESIVPLFRTPEYWMNGSEDIVRHAHNEVLELWSELGIVGPVLWLIIVVQTVRRGITVARSAAGERRGLYAALTAAYAAILVENLAGVSLRSPAVGGYAWLFAGCLWGAITRERGATARTIPVKVAWPVALLPVLLGTTWGAVTMLQQLPLFRSESRYIDARLLESRNDPDAVDAFIAAYEMCPWNPQAAMSAAGVYFRSGKSGQSLEALDAVQERFPLYPRSNLLRGMVLASLGRYRDADTCVRKELAIRSGPEGLRVQSILARAMGDTLVERNALLQLLRASMRTGRDFFVTESCARLLEIPGSDSAEVASLVFSARQQFSGATR